MKLLWSRLYILSWEGHSQGMPWNPQCAVCNVHTNPH